MSNETSWSGQLRRVESAVEAIVFASRWLLAPFYIGLSLSIVVLLIKFMFEIVHLVGHAFTMSEPEVIVGVLSLVDMALTGSLLIIVIFSGYENFVSRIDHAGHKDWPQWMGTIDFSALKLKLLSSIVAISAIQLLKQFMALDKVSDRDLYFLIVIHVVFVVSSVLLALADRIAGHDPGHAPESHSGGGGETGGHGGNGGGHASKPTHHAEAHSGAGVAPQAQAPASSSTAVASAQTKSPAARPEPGKKGQK